MSQATTGTKVSRRLENRIPPPIVFLLICGAMGALGWWNPSAADAAYSWRFVVVACCVLFSMIALGSGFVAFRKARTTIDPIRIDNASSLVTTGIYRYTRNPMYVGLATLLVAWAVYLAEPFTLLGPLFFVLFISRFQIVPEERVMQSKFGERYDEYRRRVRRWL